MLKWMHDGQYRLTEENYREYLQQEYDFYTTFDYSSVNGQEDYEADFYAAALLNEELTGAKPLDILNDGRAGAEIRGAETLTEQGQSVSGLRFTVDMDAGYNYLCFTGQKITDQGNLMATVYDGSGAVIAKVEANAPDLDGRPHQVALDLSTVKGTVTVELNAETASPDYQFSNVFMY